MSAPPQTTTAVYREGTVRDRFSLHTLWILSLVLAITTGSSSLDLPLGGRHAAVYWVDLWVLFAYPCYLVLVRRGRFPVVRQGSLVMGLALTWELFSLGYSTDPLRGARLITIHAAGLAVYLFASFVTLSGREARLVTRLFLAAPLLMLVLSAASLSGLGGTSLASAATGRVIESALGRSNALATLFGMECILGLGLWTLGSYRVLSFLGLAAAGLGLSLTGSRAGMLATLAGLSAYIWLSGSRGRRTRVLTGLGLVLFLVAGLHLSGATRALEERFSPRRPSIRQGPVRNVLIRLDYWRVAGEMFLARPLTGRGMGSFERSYLRQGSFRVDRPTDPHNQLLLLLGETGLVGTSLALMLLAILVRRAWPPSEPPEGRALRHILLATLAVAFVHSLAEPVFRNPSSVGFVAMLLGLGANPSFFLRATEPELAPGRGRPESPAPEPA